MNLTTFGDELQAHRGLMLLWTLTTIAVIASNALLPLQPVLGVTLFILAAALMVVAGISCAYTIAREAANRPVSF